MTGESLRLFLALPIPPGVAAIITDGASALRREIQGLRWTRARQQGEAGLHYHVTLWFLGGVEKEQIPMLINEIGAVTRGWRPIPLCVGGMGWFSRAGSVSVLYRQLEGEVSTLEKLSIRLQALAKGEGAPHDYKPHITIARGLAKRPARVREVEEVMENIKPFHALDFMAEEIILFNSTLTSEGPVYTPVARFALGGDVAVQ